MSDDEFWRAVDQIGIGEGTLDDICRALFHVDAAVARAKDLKKSLDAALLRHVQRTGPLAIGNIVYCAGYRTTTTARDKLAVFDTLLVHAHGDLSSAVSLLSAQPFKHGAIRDLLPRPVFSSLFCVKNEVHLGQRLLTVNTRFSGSQRQGRVQAD